MQSRPLRTALTIAASDPTGGAGLPADLQVFRALGVHGAGVITALCIEDSSSVHEVHPVFPSVVLQQLRVLLRDFQPQAIKIGALASDDVARNVIWGLAELTTKTPIVVDPVLAASDGTPLLEQRARPTLYELIARSALVTPNLPEAESLCERDVSTREGAEAAARALVLEMGANAALVKGGHRSDDADDLLAQRDGEVVTLRWLPGSRIEVGPVHGTGCVLSSAIAAGLALGRPLQVAVDEARCFVAAALRAAQAPGIGSKLLVYP